MPMRTARSVVNEETRMSRAVLALTLTLSLALAGCTKTLEAPTDAGVCWHLVSLPDGKVRFNRLAEHQAQLENCAAQLEIMRRNFRSLGAGQDSVTGAYQGQFLFVDPDGIFTAQTYSGHRYTLMVRTGDGRLAVPGAMPTAP